MKITTRLLLTIIFLLLITGCVANRYEHIKYRPDGTIKEKYLLIANKAMVNDEKKDLTIMLADGSMLGIGQVITVADPNSAKAIGEAIGMGARAFIVP